MITLARQAAARALAARGTRKFLRNRQAVVALCVIGCYLVVGLWVLLGEVLPGAIGLTLRQVEAPVASLALPGWGVSPTPERRAEACKNILDEVARALRGGEDDLRQIRYGRLRIADRPPDQTREIAAEARALYKSLDDIPDLDEAPQAEQRLSALEAKTAELWAPLTGLDGAWQSLALSLGTDRQGRSVFWRAVYSVKVALQVGIVVAVVSVLLGTLLGAAAAFYGGWVDAAVVWLYSTLSSMPELIMLAVLVYAFSGTAFDRASSPWLALVPVYAAMCLEFWIGPCRVIRGEVMKIKELEYVQAGRAMGFGRARILLRHVIPNTAHLMFINFSLLFIAAIKFEVILSFLGLGVKVGPSWGRMIQESTQEVLNGVYWQIGAATVFMFVLVLAFNIVSDALQDAFDPRHVG